MIIRRRLFISLILTLILGACTGAVGDLDEERAAEAAWEALAPHTTSHDRANWEVFVAYEVTGSDVAALFEGEPAPGCPSAATPAPNRAIEAGATYWHVVMQPVAATSLPEATEFFSPTAPPLIPEPFVREAQILLDAEGQIVAMKLGCVIY